MRRVGDPANRVGSSIRKAIAALTAALARGLEAAVVAVFAALVLVVLWGVGSRFLMNAPSRWTEEVAIFLLMWLALLGAAVAFRRQQHLGVDYFVGKLDPSAQRLLAVIGQALIGAFASSVMVYGGSVLVLETLAAGQVTPATGLPMGYVYLATPISGGFVVLFVVERAVALLSRPPEAADGIGNEAEGKLGSGTPTPRLEIEEGR